MLLPVYRNDTSPKTKEEHIAALEGWVYASFVMEELMDGLVESHNPEIDFEIFDDSKSSVPGLLYATAPTLPAISHRPCTFEETMVLDVANRKWAVQFSTSPDFDVATASAEPRLLFLGGACISFLLFGIAGSLTTTRRRALSLAEQMTEKFRTQERAVIASSNGIFITDAAQPDNPIIYANPAMEKITGYKAEELRGQAVGLLLREDTNQPDLRTLLSAMEQGGECRVILRCYRKDCTLFWNELSISPVRDSHGKISHYVGITDDITERKRAEETLRATSALQRAILDSAGYAVISTTSSGQIRIFNAAAERMTGYKAAEVIGRPTSMLVHDWTQLEERAAELSAELSRQIEPDFEVFVAKARLGLADEHEWTYLRRDGTRIPILLSVTPVRDEHGVILGFMGIASDITERKRVEDQLQQARHAAEAANRAKGEFLANMSHEIRTPMNAVIGMTELALGSELSREVRGYLSAARNSAADLLTIINDILDFSKIEAGKLELHHEPFALRDALGLTMKTFSLRAAEKSLELTLRVHADVPDSLVGDVGRLRQIVNNLVGNALKFTDQGEITVEVALAGSGTAYFTKPSRQARGSSAQLPCLLHVTVADTGIGIPLEKQQRIFDAFTQADASVTREYGGTGLGLAISSKLCHLMDGEIWVESEPARGSHFHFTASFGLAAPAESSAPLAAALARSNVLIIDDSPTNQRVVNEMLTGWRMFPVAATTAAEALTALEAAEREGTPMRFVLLDAQLAKGGDQDSADLARAIRERFRPAPSVILMQAAAGGRMDIERFRSAGVDTFLVKPVSQPELLNALLHCAGVPETSPARPMSPAEVAVAPTPALRVLLAEDNAVNRELATTVLHKLGHSVVTVVNGQQALAAWEKDPFDLILMDVQMPSMDGIEATTVIRERERNTGDHIPIFGLTAHAMLGDREHGLAAGMDEYVTKPLRLEELVRAIRKWAPPGRRRASLFHPEKLLRSLSGDHAALRRLVRIYLDTTPPLLTQLRQASERGDVAAFLHAAHTLKGSLLQLGASEATAVAAELERVSRNGRLDGTAGQVAELEAQVNRLQDAVHEWLHAEAESTGPAA
jgi:PAS domain S-box-containing protein